VTGIVETVEAVDPVIGAKMFALLFSARVAHICAA
jgi:hypothetical protein